MTPGTRVRFDHPHLKSPLTGTIAAVADTHARVLWDVIGPASVRLSSLQPA